MANFSGLISIPFEITNAHDIAEVEKIIHSTLDTFGQHDLGKLTWDNPEWTFDEQDETAAN
jgi:hypothetical protein